LTQYTEATRSASGSIFVPADVDTSHNQVLLQDSELTANGSTATSVLQIFIKAAKGTALRIASNIIASTAAGVIKSLVFTPISPYRPKGDLHRLRNYLESDDDDGVRIPYVRSEQGDSTR
jgi:hypothetical protein